MAKNDWTGIICGKIELFKDLKPLQQFRRGQHVERMERVRVHGKFQCPNCCKVWTSTRCTVEISCFLDFEKKSYRIQLEKAYKQKCRNCETFSNPDFIYENILTATDYILLRIKKVIFGIKTISVSKSKFLEAPQKPHDSESCEACQLGKCSGYLDYSDNFNCNKFETTLEDTDDEATYDENFNESLEYSGYLDYSDNFKCNKVETKFEGTDNEETYDENFNERLEKQKILKAKYIISSKETHIDKENRKRKMPKESRMKIKTSKPAKKARQSEEDICFLAFECWVCNELFKTEDLLTSHLFQTHGLLDIFQQNLKSYECYICDKVCDSQSKLDQHYAQDHEIVTNAECLVCTEIFQTEKALKKHYLIAHELYLDHPFECWVCDEIFVSEELLIGHHFEAHEIQAKVIECWICDKTFYTDFMLIEHNTQMHGF